jgi:hypothetical protein
VRSNSSSIAVGGKATLTSANETRITAASQTVDVAAKSDLVAKSRSLSLFAKANVAASSGQGNVDISVGNMQQAQLLGGQAEITSGSDITITASKALRLASNTSTRIISGTSSGSWSSDFDESSTTILSPHGAVVLTSVYAIANASSITLESSDGPILFRSERSLSTKSNGSTAISAKEGVQFTTDATASFYSTNGTSITAMQNLASSANSVAILSSAGDCGVSSQAGTTYIAGSQGMAIASDSRLSVVSKGSQNLESNAEVVVRGQSTRFTALGISAAAKRDLHIRGTVASFVGESGVVASAMAGNIVVSSGTSVVVESAKADVTVTATKDAIMRSNDTLTAVAAKLVVGGAQAALRTANGGIRIRSGAMPSFSASGSWSSSTDSAPMMDVSVIGETDVKIGSNKKHVSIQADRNQVLEATSVSLRANQSIDSVTHGPVVARASSVSVRGGTGLSMGSHTHDVAFRAGRWQRLSSVGMTKIVGGVGVEVSATEGPVTVVTPAAILVGHNATATSAADMQLLSGNIDLQSLSSTVTGTRLVSVLAGACTTSGICEGGSVALRAGKVFSASAKVFSTKGASTIEVKSGAELSLTAHQLLSVSSNEVTISSSGSATVQTSGMKLTSQQHFGIRSNVSSAIRSSQGDTVLAARTGALILKTDCGPAQAKSSKDLQVTRTQALHF